MEEIAVEMVEKKVQQYINENFSQELEFLGELVAARSDNPGTNGCQEGRLITEEAVARVVLKKFKELKFKFERVGIGKERKNVVCRWGATRARKSLILHACMDTNPIDGAYQGDPLNAFVRGERMYGWGIWNMKASIAAYAYAMAALKAARVVPAGKLLVMLVVDGIEGLGSKIGTKYLLQKGYKAKAAVLGSPGGGIGIGHRGGYRFKVTTKGEAVHTGSLAWQRGEKGKNAIVAMTEVIEVLKKTEVPFKLAKAFPGKKPMFTFPTVIRGGTKVNLVPERCEAIGDVRLMPGNSHKQVRMRIKEKLNQIEGLDYELEDVLYVPANEIDSKDEVVECMRQACLKASGKEPVVEGIGPWNSGWVFGQKDIPAIVQVPLAGGVSRWGIEWVSTTELKRLTLVMAMMIGKYLGLKRPS